MKELKLSLAVGFGEGRFGLFWHRTCFVRERRLPVFGSFRILAGCQEDVATEATGSMWLISVEQGTVLPISHPDGIRGGIEWKRVDTTQYSMSTV